jgi:hypothetical protein
MARALIWRGPQPRPERQRRRREDTSRAFTTAAKAIMLHTVRRLAAGAFRTAATRIIGRVVEAYAAAAPCMLDPMNPYWQFDIDAGSELDGDCDYASSGPSIAPNL